MMMMMIMMLLLMMMMRNNTAHVPFYISDVSRFFLSYVFQSQFVEPGYNVPLALLPKYYPLVYVERNFPSAKIGVFARPI
jgi:hypothetical protein